MADYGRSLEFGASVEPLAEPPDRAARVAVAADRAGLELFVIQDHPYQRRFLDTWTLIAWLAARTERIRFFTDVANLPLRPPAVMAKAAASLDVISGGRFELGLGAGAFWEADGAMGGPTRSPGEAIAALEEAIAVIRLLWSDQSSVGYDGSHYRLSGIKPGPKPEHEMGIWLGVGGRRALGLLGRAADGWVPSSPWAPPEKLPGLQARIDEAAASAGRDPAAIRRIYNVFGLIRDRESEGFFRGPVEQWVDELTALAVEHGMDSFIFGPASDPLRQVQRFAAEVAPAVRDAVARHRR